MSTQQSVIAVLSGKGGVGKTTISAGLGCVYAALGLKVLIIDMDMGLRNLDLQFQVQGDILFDLSHVLDGYLPLSEAIISVPQHPNLSILASSLQKNFSSIDPEQIKTMMNHATDLFDIVILDAPAGADPLLLEIVHYCDAALLVSHPYLPSLRSVDKLLGMLSKNLPKYWVINRMPTTILSTQQKNYLKDVDFPLCGSVPEIPDLLAYQAENQPLSHKGFFKALYPIALVLINQKQTQDEQISLDDDKEIAKIPQAKSHKKWKDFIANFALW
ncbi:hypothetical protein EBR43_01770 [bacterium]|jgi:septum site-determining protein MinD|nr:hypothetical protein [bacterium]NBW56515.1 hypothetical protein [bacterium]NBX72594.1 hypothetical protein [bacterium]